MSDALNYLIAARPKAVAPYFEMLKEAGKHLDTRSRDLISVITKVDAQTDAGFRQYLTRALRNGATANEVLDALFMAFPTLGFAKIVWAVEILLDMDIPEFHPENLDAKPDWHEVGPLDGIPSGEISYHECGGRNLYIYRDGNALKVYDSRCPHQVTNIPHLALEGTTLTCPKHHWKFDVTSGECIDVGNRPLNEFEHKVEDGILKVYW
jgi:nitrite reductase/ring-hydroxylating ferredoxin subunit/alkylhydroperoxidase/carboxymuconolactone decarboxylase family protein YurZ